jgi:hypothetical protein
MVHFGLVKWLKDGPKLEAVFFKQEASGDEPVRSWLKSLPNVEERKANCSRRHRPCQRALEEME